MRETKPRLAALALAMSATLAATLPAAAVMRGEKSRDPQGVRRASVRLETPAGLCSGTIIGRNLVLTAAHCVSAPGRYRVVYLDDRFRPRMVAAIRTTQHHSFDARHGFSPHDLGLIAVATPFPASIVPAVIPGWTGNVATGERVKIAGFGGTESPRLGDRVLRESEMVAAGPPPDGPAFGGLVGPGDKRTGMCEGDSGGGVFRSDQRGLVLVGILKGGPADRRMCTDTPVYVPVGRYSTWIQHIADDWQTPLGR